MRGEEELIPVLMRLRGAAPQAWDEFVMAMRRMAAIKAAELVRAPTETVHQVQGQARAWEDIVEMLINAPKKAERAEELRRGRAEADTRPPSPAYSACY